MTLPDEMKARLQRFQAHLLEEDAKGIRDGLGYCVFSKLSEDLDEIAHIYKYKIRPSHLTWKSADKFAWKLGEDLMALVEKEHKKFSQGKYDWHELVDLGRMARLGWDIKYHNHA